MLKFVGHGSAFNTKLGNNSAYIKEGNTLFLIDCGSNTFDRIKEQNLLNGVEKIYVLITHTHPDHVGSLGDLIFYSYYSMGKMGEPCVTVLSPKDVLVELLLKVMGVNSDLYNTEKFDEDMFINEDGFQIFLEGRKVNHVKELNCYAYVLTYKDETCYYSGDSNEIFDNILHNLHKGSFDYFYQDTCKADYEGNVHLSLRKLDELIDKSVRHKVYCMHLDESFDVLEAKKLGFNTVVPIVYQEGDIFNIEGIEYAIRIINWMGVCWLEQILYRNENEYLTAGKNKTIKYEELDNYELVTRFR